MLRFLPEVPGGELAATIKAALFTPHENALFSLQNLRARSNKEAKEEAELEAELELEMKTLSPQAPSPLGSPFLWPGVEGPDSPGSPKPGAPHATPHMPQGNCAHRPQLLESTCHN